MLVNRKQEWDYYQPPAPQPVITAKLRPYPSIRKQCLQLIALAAALAMLITVHSEIIVRAGYDLMDMKVQVAKMEKENDLLRLEVAKLKSPQRIQQIATTKLGMVQPQNTYYAAAAPKTTGASPSGEAAGRVASALNMKKAEAKSGR
jgi:cell division protein FtsL